MATLNKVFLVGNLTREPQLRYTPAGSAVCQLGLASNRKYKKAEVLKEETTYVDITVWGKDGENCSQYLEKGSKVLVEGRLNFQSWKDSATQQNRSKLIVVAEHVQFLSVKSPKKDEIPGEDEQSIPF